MASSLFAAPAPKPSVQSLSSSPAFKQPAASAPAAVAAASVAAQRALASAVPGSPSRAAGKRKTASPESSPAAAAPGSPKRVKDKVPVPSTPARLPSSQGRREPPSPAPSRIPDHSRVLRDVTNLTPVAFSLDDEPTITEENDKKLAASLPSTGEQNRSSALTATLGRLRFAVPPVPGSPEALPPQSRLGPSHLLLPSLPSSCSPLSRKLLLGRRTLKLENSGGGGGGGGAGAAVAMPAHVMRTPESASQAKEKRDKENLQVEVDASLKVLGTTQSLLAVSPVTERSRYDKLEFEQNLKETRDGEAVFVLGGARLVVRDLEANASEHTVCPVLRKASELKNGVPGVSADSIVTISRAKMAQVAQGRIVTGYERTNVDFLKGLLKIPKEGGKKSPVVINNESLAGHEALLKEQRLYPDLIKLPQVYVRPDDLLEGSQVKAGFWFVERMVKEVNCENWDKAKSLAEMSPEDQGVLRWALQIFIINAERAAKGEKECVGDFRPRNVMYNSRGELCIVDPTKPEEANIQLYSCLRDWFCNEDLFVSALEQFPADIRQKGLVWLESRTQENNGRFPPPDTN